MAAKICSFTGHTDCVYALEPGPGPGGFFSAGGDGKVILWNTSQPDTGKLVARAGGAIYALTYLPDTNRLLIAVNQKGLYLIDLEEEKEIWHHPAPASTWFRLVRRNHYAWAAGNNGTILRIDLRNFEVWKEKAGTHNLRALDAESMGNRLAAGSSAGLVYLFEGDKQNHFQAHKDTVFGLHFYPLGNQMVSCGKDARLKLWAAEANGSFSLQHEVAAHLFGIHDVAVHPAKPILATASMDKTIKIWDAYNLKLLRVLDKSRHAGHGHSINQIVWLPEQELLLSCSDDRTISAWNIFA